MKPTTIASACGRGLHALWLGVAGLVILAEEWGWRPLTALAARFTRWPPLARLEARIAAAPRHVALGLFVVPAVLLMPVKLGALWLIEQGRPVLGIGLIVAAKIVGTAFVGRLFMLVEAQLMTFAWFARLVAGWRGIKRQMLHRLRGSALWRSVRAARRAWRAWRHGTAG